MKYLDVDSLTELPHPPEGYRYYDFIGGTKELRCFLCRDTTSRGTFMNEYKNHLDEALKPIYEKNGVVVAQDTSYPLPGFYIISTSEHIKSIDLMNNELYTELLLTVKKVRDAQRKILKIDFVHILYEEKNKKSCHVHFWALPIYDINSHPRLDSLNIKEYLSGYSFRKNKENIILANQKMRDHLNREHT